MRRVVITGCGIVSGLGIGTDSNWSALCAGRSAIRPCTFDATFGAVPSVGALVDRNTLPPLKDLVDRSRRSMIKLCGPEVHFALAAMREALGHARINLAEHGGELGLCSGIDPFVPLLHAEQQLGVELLVVHPAVPCSNAAIMLGGLHGPVSANVDFCCAGMHAIGHAYEQIVLGKARFMLAGATETLTNSQFLARFTALGAVSISPDPRCACMPFDRERSGTALGEGSAYLLLEDLESAEARGVTPIAEIVGYRNGNDCQAMTDPRADGSLLAAALSRAQEDGEVDTSDLGYLKLHATGTKTNDAAEAAVARIALGDSISRTYCGGLKQAVGHLNAAAGAIETAFVALGLRDQLVPPHLFTKELAPECAGLRLPPRDCAVQHDYKAAAALNLGFGGFFSAIVLKRW